jgi:hypothetical protein
MTHSTLFGHLAARFVAQRENLATEALAYILAASRAARIGLVQHIDPSGSVISGDLSFSTQVSGADQVIPDLVGTDEAGNPRLVIEAKFWAGLTEAQPTGYLRRMAESGGVLAFLAPAERAEVLWNELSRRCSDGGFSANSTIPTDGRCAQWSEVGDSLHLTVTTWRGVLGAMEAAARDAGEGAVLADIQQLRGLCDREDSEAFLPIDSEELTGMQGRRIVQISNLVDDLADRLSSGGLANTRNLRASAGKGWYGKYMRIGQCAALLHFSAWKWGTLAMTPLWLQVMDGDWKPRPGIARYLRQVVNNPVFERSEGAEVAFWLPIGAERDTVLSGVYDQLEVVARAIATIPTQILAGSASLKGASEPAPDADPQDILSEPSSHN